MNFYENEPISLFLRDLKIIEKYTSSKQSVLLMEHDWLGKVLVLNGEIQHIEKYQSLYHEQLVHIPAVFIPQINDVLILGGGSLFAIYEVLKYPSVQNVVLCDHDSSVLQLMAKHYIHANEILKNPKFKYIELDGKNYLSDLSSTSKRFDLVINDCFNLAFESGKDNISYYRLLSNLCTKSGVCVDIIYRHIFDRQVTVETLQYLSLEKHLALSLVVVPEYPGILHLETIWGSSPLISQNAKQSANKYHKQIVSSNQASPFLFFYPTSIPFYFYLPPYIKKMFSL